MGSDTPKNNIGTDFYWYSNEDGSMGLQREHNPNMEFVYQIMSIQNDQETER